MKQKIFGIGLGRTGTKSLAKAMAILGYKVKHSPKYVDEIDNYDFINDIFIAARYKFLDYMFPDAKFILTIRDTESWIASCVKHDGGGRRARPLRRAENRFLLYGRTDFNRRFFEKFYPEFNGGVISHFGNNYDKLLIFNICGGEGWNNLCSFLGKEIPTVKFPHLNSS